MSAPILGCGLTVEINGKVFNGAAWAPTPEQWAELGQMIERGPAGPVVRLPGGVRGMRPIAAERIGPGLPVTFDAAGRAVRWQPVPPIHFADEAIEPGDVLLVMPDGAVRIADRAEAARRAARADVSPAAAGDVSRCPRCEGTGRYQGLPQGVVSRCGVCDGTGLIRDVSPVDRRDTSPGSADDGPDTAIVARAET